MGDNVPKKPQSFFEKLRAAMTTLRRPATVPRQPDGLPVYSLTIATGSGSFVDSTTVSVYGESSRATPTTAAPTQAETKKSKRSKQARSKKHGRKSQDNSEESTSPETQKIESPAGAHAATPTDQEDTNPTDVSETAESDAYSTAQSSLSRASVQCKGQNAPRKAQRQKQADDNTAKGHHGNTHARAKMSSPANHSRDKRQSKSMPQKIDKTTPNADVSGLPSVHDRAPEIVSRPGTSHSALVKIFLANPLTQTDCDSVPVYLEIPEPEQSNSKTQTTRVATVSVNQQSALFETHFNNKTPRSGTKHENSTKTSKVNKKSTSSKGHSSSRGTANNTTARGSLKSNTSRHSTKPLSLSKKTDKLYNPALPTSKQVIFHKMPPNVRSINDSKQRDSTDRPKTTNYQATDKSKTEEQSSGNGLGSSQLITSFDNQDSVGCKNNVSTGSNLQVRPQTCSNVSSNSRTQDNSPSKRENAVSSKDRSRSHASSGCSSKLRPQTSHDGRNSRMQTVSSANRSRSNASNGCGSPLRPKTSQDSRNLRMQETPQLKHDNTTSSTDRPRSSTSNGCSSVLRPEAARCSSNSRAYIGSQSKLNKMISPTNRSRSSTSDRNNSQLQSGTSRISNSSRPCLASQSKLKTTLPMNQSRSNVDSCNTLFQAETSTASSNTRVFLASQLKLHKTISPTDASKSNNVPDGCESQPRSQTARCSSNTRVYLGQQLKREPTFSPTTVRRPNTTPGKVLNETQFQADLKSDSSIVTNTITNILPSGINKHESPSRVADTLENCPVSFTITVPSEHHRLRSGRQISRERQGNSNLQLLYRPSTSKRYSNMQENARTEVSPPNIRPTTSFPFSKVDKLRRITQNVKPANDAETITVPLIREKTYLILPSPNVSGSNDDASKAILPTNKCTLLTRQNTFLILPTQENGQPISKRKSLNKISGSTPLMKKKISHGEVSKIASDNLVTNTSSAIPLAKGNTYLIMPGTSACREEGHEDNFIIPLMKKSTYLVLPSKKHSTSEIKIHRSCGNIPLIRSSTYEIIKSKRIFSMP